MRWGEPQLWWLGFVPLLVIALFVFGHLRRRDLLRKAGEHPLIQKMVASVHPEMRLVKQLMVFLGITLVAVAAIRPQYGRSPQPLRQTGVDIAIAFDISKSMLARDVQPSRLDAARGQLEQLLDGLTGHRMALIPFAGIAFVQSPLTADRSAIRLYMESLNPKTMPVGGTNIAAAIDEGVRVLTSTEDRGDRASRSRVVLLITDGEAANPQASAAAEAAAKRAAEKNVLVFAVAVGTRLGEPIPILNEDGTHAGYQKDSQQKPIYSKLDVPLLESLADLADPANVEVPRVFPFDGSAPVVAGLRDALDGLQKSTLEASIRHRYGEKFQYLLFPALLLLLAELLLSDRRRRVVERGNGAADA